MPQQEPENLFMHDSTAIGVARRTAGRALAILAAAVAAILVLSFTSFAASTRAAALPATRAHGAAARTVAPPRASTLRTTTADAPAPKKVVIVVAPMGDLTDGNRDEGNDIAAAATAAGMNVIKLYSPHATWENVVAAANGADFFIYLGHGNGWPSPYAPYQENSKDGLGLNSYDGAGDYSAPNYVGAKKIVQSIHFAPNAIVMLSHACYTVGNSEPGMVIPNQDTAVWRVDNFAQGFLAAGARTVFSLYIQPGVDLMNALIHEHKTMDGFFMTSYGSNRDGSWKPYYGWVGWKSNLYFDANNYPVGDVPNEAMRSPGRIHLDPDSPVAGNYPGNGVKMGYERAVIGDLDFTTDAWLNGVDTGDNKPPVISDLSGAQASDTIPADTSGPAIFTPNKDGLSDTLTINHTLSEPSYLDVTIRKASDDSVVKRYTGYSDAGQTTETWNGKNTAGSVVPDGRYDITIRPTDRAGNVGDPATTSVKVLTAMKAPKASPTLFFPTDHDALSQAQAFSVSLTKPASLTWKVFDSHGSVVKVGMSDEDHDVGSASWTWDGTDRNGDDAPDGIYTSIITATTSNGSYSHKVNVRLMPYKVSANKWKVGVGATLKLTIICAEPQKGWPKVTIKQPGVAKYSAYMLRYSATEFHTSVKMKSGGTLGDVSITIVGTDTGNGVDTRVFHATLE